jgi:hypothetical protein
MPRLQPSLALQLPLIRVPRPSRHCRLLSFSLALLAAVLLSFAPVQAQEISATYSHGALSVTIPYHAERAASGRLIAEVLDPEDHVLGRSERSVDLAQGGGSWQQSIALEKPLPVADIVWQRVRYRFASNAGKAPAIEGVESISQILRRPILRILGQSEYLAGSQAAVRVIVSATTSSDTAPSTVPTGSVRIELIAPVQTGAPAAQPQPLFSGRLDRRGTLDAEFKLPAGLTGTASLHFVADTPIGSTEYTQSIRLDDKASILLTTEKPIYQPGQTIHIRALALDREASQAEAAHALTFEIEDPRGNKVFKKATQTDKFGIASAEFTLADEVNLGAYHLRALMGPAAAPTNTAQVALNVERYVLPKFKVEVEFTKKDGKPQRDYRPGDHITGTIRANYFFGKPVDHADITLKASGMDVAAFQAASATGKTDADGAYRFDLKLPSYFAGRPLSQGAARALVEATVKDSAAHAETRGEPITISQSSLLVTAVPESGTLVPHIDNQVFLVTSYPDGTPAKTTLTVNIPGDAKPQHVFTDAGGIAVIHLTPGDRTPTLDIAADDHHGKQAKLTVPLESRNGTDQILLRTGRAVVKAGERIQLKVLSTRAIGTAYIDIVRNGQTILTRDLDLQNGHADLTLTATPAMAGTLDIDAYLIGRDAQPVADHRLLFVQPADELHIETTADAAVYKPGDDARIHFHVTNARGEGVSAALGLQIVDEAVFALAEKQPGFAKVFFYLEQEVMKPRYEIHSLSMPDAIADPLESSLPRERRDLAARALFSATEMVAPAQLDVQAGQSLPQDKFLDYQQRYRTAFIERVRRLTEAHPIVASPVVYNSRSANGGNGGRSVTALTLDDGSHPTDAWNTPIRIESQGWNQSRYGQVLVRSAGADRRFDTADDLIEVVLIRYKEEPAAAAHAGQTGGSLYLNIEHVRGPVSAFGEVTGTVVDRAGAAIPGATITLRRASTQELRIAQANAAGQFILSALPAGRYRADITSPGFADLHSEFTLDPRDRAVLAVTLPIGAATETITVTDAPSQLQPLDALSDDAMLGGTIENELYTQLPLAMSGAPRSPTASQQLMPGVQEGAAIGVAGGAQRGVYGGTGQANLGQNYIEGVPVAGTATRARIANGASAAITLRGRVGSAFLAPALALPAAATSPAAAAPHIRSYFPEALYINPEILTDDAGNATISVPIADNITTWRMAMLASTASGALGTGNGSVKVFQDFFIDLDLPVTLTQGDRVTLPVAIYNYSGKSGRVTLSLQPEADLWYSLANDDTPEKSVAVESGRVGDSQFTLNANRIGKFKLTLTAHMDGRDDIVVREIEVIPNGREQSLVFNGRLDATPVRHELMFPAGSIPDATSLLVRLYPGPLSQVIEGMDSILRMPGGCFEQTSSSTYPNVLALDYMKRTKKLTPEVHAKAEGYIANGYQRLLTFEVPGGGFSWFGRAPANKILTAYGLMEFNDMAKVSDVDPRLIQRTGDWLARQQQPDGSWRPDTAFINEGATNRYNSDVLRITAYIAWSLANTGYRGPAVNRARQFIASRTGTKTGVKTDAYTLAVIANFAADYAAAGHDRDNAFTRSSMQALLDARTEKDEQVFWSTEETGVYSTGASAAIETTGLAAQALLKWGQAGDTTRKALNFISSKKQASGNWGTTQATITALRAVLLASEVSASDSHGAVEVLLNGKTVESLQLTPENDDLLHQFVLKNIDATQPASVELRFSGAGGLAYQVVGRYFTPYDAKPATEALSIDVAYDRTHLAENDIATATATIHNNLSKTANMVMVDLGIPPGFELLSEDLQSFQEKTTSAAAGRLEKFSITATQAILYFNALAPKQTVTLNVRLRAKYPIRARTFSSRVYEYYDPDVTSTAAPVQLEVSRR